MQQSSRESSEVHNAGVEQAEMEQIRGVLSFVSVQSELKSLLAGCPDYLRSLIESDFCVMSIKDAGSVGYQQYNLYGVVSEHDLVYNPGDPQCGPFARLYKKGVDSPFVLKACYEELHNNVTWLHIVLRTESNVFGVLSFGCYSTKVYSVFEKEAMVKVCSELSRKIVQFSKDDSSAQEAEAV